MSLLSRYNRKRNECLYARAIKQTTRAFNEYSTSHEIKKLQVGCGINLIPDFFNTDIVVRPGVSYLNACKPMPFSDNTFDYIFSEHSFEHLSYAEGRFFLGECINVLKPGGVLRLSMPGLDFLMNIINNPSLPEHQEYLRWHFDSFAQGQYQDFGELSPVLLLNNFMHMWGHKCIYDRVSLKRMIERVGFTDVTFCEISQSQHEHLRQVERHQYKIPEKMNAIETMVVEATKPIR